MAAKEPGKKSDSVAGGTTNTGQKTETSTSNTTSSGSKQNLLALKTDREPATQSAGPVLRRLSDVEPEEVQWLWPRRVPLGKLTLLVGDPGVGKSFVTLDIAARVSSGATWPDDPTTPVKAGTVVLLSAEDDPADTIRPRLDAMGADPEHISLLRGVWRAGTNGEQHFSLARDLNALEEAISGVKARLVVVDPISAYLGKTDSHKNADIRGLLAPLAAIASRRGCAVLAVSHLNKNEEGRAIYRATGSLAFVAAARMAWLVGKDPDDPQRRLMLPLKANVIQTPVGIAYSIEDRRVKWDPAPVDVDPDAILGDQGSKTTKSETATTFLKGILARGSVPAVEVQMNAEYTGISHTTLERAKKALGVKSRKECYGEDGRWLWELPS